MIPSALELVMVSSILYTRCGRVFAALTMTTFALYLAVTVAITRWRMTLRRQAVSTDNARNGYFIDSILNQETVKLFCGEERESATFDGYLRVIERLAVKSTLAIAVLNVGQVLVFCVGLTLSLLLAWRQVQVGRMTVGDVVAVNAMLLQLAIPFNFMGYTCTCVRVYMCAYVGVCFFLLIVLLYCCFDDC